MTALNMKANSFALTAFHRSSHTFVQTCVEQKCDEQDDDRPPPSDIGFNEPDSWGFCEYCAYMVARSLDDGLLERHPKRGADSSGGDCNGSGREPIIPAPIEATRRPFVSITKPHVPKTTPLMRRPSDGQIHSRNALCRVEGCIPYQAYNPDAED